MFFVTVSLSLLSSDWLREATGAFGIGERVMQGQVAVTRSPALFFFLQTRYAFIFVRSLAALFEILCSPPRNDGLTLEHSIGHISRENAGICPFSCFRQSRQDVPSRISQTQQISSESAGFPQISKITANQQDSSEPSRPPNPADFRPRLSRHRVTSPHGYPQPGAQPRSHHLSSRDTSDFLGFVWGSLWA